MTSSTPNPNWEEKYPTLATMPNYTNSTNNLITENQWEHFEEKGWVVLPKSQVFQQENELTAIQETINAIQTGTASVPYDQMMMQLDSTTGKYEDSGSQTLGHKGASLRYRKIQNLDLCPLIMNYLRKPLYEEACRKIYGDNTPIASFRTMFFNKPSRLNASTSGGTSLPWHQDRWKYLDRDPLLNVYLALDTAVPESGCMKIISGSHKYGVINPEHHSAFLSEKNCIDLGLLSDTSHANKGRQKNPNIEDFWLHPGEVALMHNWVIHCSGVNSTENSRRALSISYMDARSKLNLENFSHYVGGELKTTGYPEGAMDFPKIFDAKK
jgi:phytanoyl-CoA hydroxylase